MTTARFLIPAIALALSPFLARCDGSCGAPPADESAPATVPDTSPTGDDGATGGPTAPSASMGIALGGPGEDRGHAVAVDEDGSFFVTGGFQGEVDFDPGAASDLGVSRGVVDGFVARFAADGTELWSRTLGGPGLDEARAVAVAPDGSALVAGVFQGTMDLDPGPATSERTSRGDVDVFVIRLDDQGGAVLGLAFGGPGADHAHDVAVTEDGGFVVVGRFQSEVDFDPSDESAPSRSAGLDDGFVVSLSPSGALRWARTLQGPGLVQARAVALRGDGSAVVSGLFTIRADLDPGDDVDEHVAVGRSDAFVLALDQDGRLLWARTFGGAGADYGLDVAAGPDGGVAVVGRFSGTADLDPGPAVSERESEGGPDLFVVSLSPAGELLWARTAGGPGIDLAAAVAVADDGSITLAGGLEGTVDLDPGERRAEVESAGGLDAFVLSLGADGEHLWSSLIGGAEEDRAAAVALGPGGAAVVAGELRGGVRLPPGHEEHGAQRADAFVVTLSR